MARKKSKKISVNTSGKRKTAVARATVRKGKGRVRVNGEPIHIMGPSLAQRKALEPVQIAEAMNRLGDVDVHVDDIEENTSKIATWVLHTFGRYNLI